MYSILCNPSLFSCPLQESTLKITHPASYLTSPASAAPTPPFKTVRFLPQCFWLVSTVLLSILHPFTVEFFHWGLVHPRHRRLLLLPCLICYCRLILFWSSFYVGFCSWCNPTGSPRPSGPKLCLQGSTSGDESIVKPPHGHITPTRGFKLLLL